MARARRLLLSLTLLAACDTKGEATTTQPTPATPPSSTLDAEIVETAITATTVQKIKVRVDGKGGIEKQSVYHDKADAIPKPVLELAKTRWPGATIRHYET